MSVLDCVKKVRASKLGSIADREHVLTSVKDWVKDNHHQFDTAQERHAAAVEDLLKQNTTRRAAILDQALTDRPELAKRYELTKPKPPPPAPVEPPVVEAKAAKELVSPPEEDHISSVMNKATAAEREARGMSKVDEPAERAWQTVMDEAATKEKSDPAHGTRLVEELKEKPRPIADTEVATLLREQIRRQREHSDAVDAVNKAQTPEDLMAASSRRDIATQSLQDVYEAGKKAGTSNARGLNIRSMLAKEDYSLAAMEARKRAGNNGKISREQLRHTEMLHEQIKEMHQRITELEKRREVEKTFREVLGEAKTEARLPKFGRNVIKFLEEKEANARARRKGRLGRLSAGVDPTILVDEAIIGAAHIARGTKTFAEFSARMVKDAGDWIKPHLRDIWVRANAYHNAALKASRTPSEVKSEGIKTRIAKQTADVRAKIEREEFAKPTPAERLISREEFKMRANLEKLKHDFERRVNKDIYNNKSYGQKFWDHFVGFQRAMKLSGPGVFGKLGSAAMVREVLAPIEAGGAYGVRTVFPKFVKGTRYDLGLRTMARAELKAKAEFITTGIKDSWENFKGHETALEALAGGKHSTGPDFWYHRIGKYHAMIKAPVKRAAFTRALEAKMDVAQRAGEDLTHPAVMERLINESVMEGSREIFQEKTVVSHFFGTLDQQRPAAAKVARFFFPVVKIPVNIFKELVNLHVGAPVGAIRIGKAYWHGVETLPVAQREAIVRQLVKGSIGGAALLWSYYNHDKVEKFMANTPKFFQHTPFAAILHEGPLLYQMMHAKGLKKRDAGHEFEFHVKTTIPFAYTITSAYDVIKGHDSKQIMKWINDMTQSTVVPQLSSQIAKTIDTPGSFPSNLPDRSTYRTASNPIEAIKLGIPGWRQTVPVTKKKGGAGRLKPGEIIVPGL